ncbi:hypothetical protein R3P38DRAFT_3039051 [Favolaschia claudopus]|uniref:F-box domain-containing protein n=1 Tax=Favolaschia claudopus TaxID=2862362 RepID=A0AAW0A9B3_9AGAR
MHSASLREKSLRKELACLKDSIAQQCRLLTQLQGREALVEAEVDALSFKFPILTLPLEITAEVFLHYAAAVHEEDCKPYEPCRAMLLLLEICHTWRTIALSTPALWVTLDVGIISHLAPGKIEQEADRWLSRAGALPLSFVCHRATISPWFGQANSIVSRHALRLRKLHIAISHGSVAPLFESSFPLLEDIDICNVDSQIRSTPFVAPVSTLARTPKLRRVVLDGIPPSSLTASWGLLESFSALSTSTLECIYVLRAAPGLRKLKYYGAGAADDTSVAIDGIVTLPLLTCLALCNASHAIIPYLALPALTTLEFCGVYSLDSNSVLDLLSRTRGLLRDLDLSNHTMPFTISIKWFQHMKQLTRLKLSRLRPQSRAELVRSLNRALESEFLPVLEALVLTDWKPDEVDKALLEAVNSRSSSTEVKPERVLARLDVKISSLEQDTELVANVVGTHEPLLRDLIRRGMDIRITSQYKSQKATIIFPTNEETIV